MNTFTYDYFYTHIHMSLCTNSTYTYGKIYRARSQDVFRIVQGLIKTADGTKLLSAQMSGAADMI